MSNDSVLIICLFRRGDGQNEVVVRQYSMTTEWDATSTLVLVFEWESHESQKEMRLKDEEMGWEEQEISPEGIFLIGMYRALQNHRKPNEILTNFVEWRYGEPYFWL